MKITNEFLKEKSACTDGFRWVNEQGIVGLEHTEFIKYLLAHDHYDYSNWLITKMLDKDNLIRYAIFAAEQVLDIYEKKYPGDDRPRKAIEAAKEYLKTHSKSAALPLLPPVPPPVPPMPPSAMPPMPSMPPVPPSMPPMPPCRHAARAAVYAVYAARAAVYAAYVARAADAADAARAADAAVYAADAVYVADLRTKIINYGMKLIEK